MLKVRMVLDSGAYTAWSHGEEINIDDYIAYAKRNQHLISHVVNLDVIPGKWGIPRTQQDVEESAAKSYENLRYMKANGINPMPVFHQGERFYWLDRLLEDGETYVGISPSADLPTQTVRRWLDMVFTRLTNPDGSPIIKTHGFGMTAFELIKRYPWESIDSATWAFIAAYGTIIIPQFIANTPRFDKPPYKVIVSGIPRKQKLNDFAQYETLGPTLQEAIKQYLRNHLDLSISQVVYDDKARRKCTAYFMLRYVETCKDIRFNHRMTGVLE